MQTDDQRSPFISLLQSTFFNPGSAVSKDLCTLQLHLL